MRISSLPDGCNRIDEPWGRSHINDEYDEYGGPCYYVHYETITKENFVFFFEDEIEEQQKFGEFIEGYFDDSIKSQGGETMEMIVQKRQFSIGCETVGFSPIGALSGEEIPLLSIEDNKTLQAIKASKKAQRGEDVNWWDIYSTQEEIDAAIARIKRAHRTKIVKIEMDIVIN